MSCSLCVHFYALAAGSVHNDILVFATPGGTIGAGWSRQVAPNTHLFVLVAELEIYYISNGCFFCCQHVVCCRCAGTWHVCTGSLERMQACLSCAQKALVGADHPQPWEMAHAVMIGHFLTCCAGQQVGIAW